jgi:hypothetical protein
VSHESEAAEGGGGGTLVCNEGRDVVDRDSQMERSIMKIFQ